MKNIKFLAFTILFMLTMVLAACGGNDETSENNSGDKADDGKLELGQEEITIPYVSWPSAVASSNVIKVHLKNKDMTLI
ncbi:hypothetical protein [Lentibacillus cibarius]|uniref:Uncharacterized protein n=1 Tax=Lentibacillus cibarius TaxID=2583219 RepID=A0A5S3QIX5_9BACI|nr:hypothetical protein [Lentibacillus cibarius]TMN21679.1 hypothetical protein FFL34_05810 [Lentibacillus cibarius]